MNRRHRRRLSIQNRRRQRDAARSRERSGARGHFVEHRAQGEDVAARVGEPASDLFGRHVLQRPHEHARLGQIVPRRNRVDRAPAGHRERLNGLRQPEVEQLHPALREHHVSRLQIAMHDPLAMRVVERVGDLDAISQRLFDRQRPLRQPVEQRFTLEQLHDEELRLAFVADVVEGADMGMGELRHRPRLALEALRVLPATTRCLGITL